MPLVLPLPPDLTGLESLSTHTYLASLLLGAACWGSTETTASVLLGCRLSGSAVQAARDGKRRNSLLT